MMLIFIKNMEVVIFLIFFWSAVDRYKLCYKYSNRSFFFSQGISRYLTYHKILGHVYAQK